MAEALSCKQVVAVRVRLSAPARGNRLVSVPHPKGTPHIKSHGIKLGLTGKTFEFVKETLRCIWVGKPPFGEASTCHAILAQSVEQRFRKAKVVGSSPTDGSILGFLSLAVCAYSRQKRASFPNVHNGKFNIDGGQNEVLV